MISLLLSFFPVHPLHQAHGEQDDHRKDHGNGTTEVPVSNRDKLGLDQVTDEHVLSASQKLRNNEGGNGKKENHHNTIYHTRQGQLPDHLPEGLETVGTQIVGCLDQGFVHFIQGGMDRNDHKWHKVADQTYHYGKVRIHHADGTQPDFCQKVVDDSIIRQQVHPGIGTKKHIDPHWNGYQHDQKSLHFFGTSCDDQGQGISQHQTDKGGEKSQPEGFQDYVQVSGFQKFHKVSPGEGKGHNFVSFGGERIQDNQKKWDHKDEDCPDKVGDDQALKLFH